MNASNEVISNYVEQRITRLEVSHENIVQSLARIEKAMADGFSGINDRFKQVDERFNRVDERFNRIDDRISRVENRLWQMMFLFPAVIFSLIVTHALHWT